MKKPAVSLLLGIASIIVTILLYFLILGNVLLEIICFMTLIGVVVAEILTMLFAFFSKGSPRKVAAAVISGLMIPFSIILSIVYIVCFPEGYITYLCIYFIGLIVVYASALVFYRFDAKSKAENNELQKSKENMLNMRKIVKCIMADSEAQPYLKELRKLEEALHFSNDSVIASQDENIYNMLAELQLNISSQGYDVNASIERIIKQINIRNIVSNTNV